VPHRTRGGVASEGSAGEGTASTPTAAPSDRRRLAILPLAKIHPDRDEDYFADGMTEELISVVSRIQGLDVIARTSVMAYRDTTKSVTEIGRELDVGTVLEGSVRKAGDQLRITVQLIDASTQGHLWSRDYDREFREVFAVQSDIARHVAEALEVTLLGAEERRIDRAPTANLEAYDHYLLGRHHLNKRTDSGLRTAIDHFEEAAELDPGFAPAPAGLADVYALAAIGYAAIPDAISRARDAAERALELDPELPDAHASLGYVALNAGWEWRTAERELERAIELNPSDARAHQWYAQVALYRLYLDEAEARYERARELDPLSVVIQNESGWPALYALDLEKAMDRFRKAASMDPSFAMAHFNIGNCHDAAGRLDDALACYRKAAELSDRVPFIRCFQGSALARSGEEDAAREILEELRAREEEGASLSLWLAVVHEALGDRNAALRELERALENREPVVVGINTPWLPFPTLRDEPRFQRLQAEVRERMDQRR